MRTTLELRQLSSNYLSNSIAEKAHDLNLTADNLDFDSTTPVFNLQEISIRDFQNACNTIVRATDHNGTCDCLDTSPSYTIEIFFILKAYM